MGETLLWGLWGSGVPVLLVSILVGWYVWPPKRE